MTKVLMFLITFMFSINLNATPVQEHGFLQAKNSYIYDQNERVFQLKGVSSHGLQWFGDDITYESMRMLRDVWGINVIRAAMYTDQDGYIKNPNIKFKVWDIVLWGIELGIYVVIDWHILYDGDPLTYMPEAINFFSEASSKFSGYPNVIYEICNEPNGQNITWERNIKPYATEVIREIRKNDRKNLIIVGSSTWSSDIHEPANSPIYDRNTAYAVHFYAGTTKESFMQKIEYAMSRGITPVVTEWGITDSSGNGEVFYEEAKKWVLFMKIKNIGHISWSYSRANESSAMLMPNGTISQTGRFIKYIMIL
jgi:endoglucanase